MMATAVLGWVWSLSLLLLPMPLPGAQVVRMIETYDTTTIRASTPMFLMARKIKAMGVKMVLSGEGADEVCPE